MSDLNITTMLRWEAQSEWHLALSELHAKTYCGTTIPHVNAPVQHLKTGPIHDVKGLCFKCFHALCIEEQNEGLWSIYYKAVEG